MKNKILTLLAVWVFLIQSILSQGNVYLIIGSDTAIWDGMSTAKYNCTYDAGLFTDPAMNGYKVMDPLFRNQLKDSYGGIMKMTWWMMAGNIFRYATNTDVPIANNITLFSMKEHHLKNIEALGDELSLHYHTFAWTDYDKDGKYWWNQAQNFLECKDDFDITLAHFLIEENVYPVSFRSGWHYMDNEWQNYLDGLIPYSMHNDYPAVREDIIEPTDNNFDWSKASKEFVPYHPSLSDYQLEGNGKSWNTRSKFMGSVSQAMMDQIFAKAAAGVDQVPCFWAHLPETDFLDNMKRIDSLAHISVAKYPDVKFRYCTAIEAMQLWRKGTDITPPEVTIEESVTGSDVKFIIHSNEEIFQKTPFVAAKNIYEEYFVLECNKLNENSWITKEALPLSSLAKVGTALTDTMGNLTTKFISYLPDDIYIDNSYTEYKEIRGSWTNSLSRTWGTDARKCIIAANDSAVAEWRPVLHNSGMFNLCLQIPALDNPADIIHFRVSSVNSANDTLITLNQVNAKEWNYIATVNLDTGDAILMSAYGSEQEGKTLAADVLRISALVKDRAIEVKDLQLMSNIISEKDSVVLTLKVQNQGIQNLEIQNIYSTENYFSADVNLPIIIKGMNNADIPVVFYSERSGEIQDTLIIISDDPAKPVIKMVYNLQVEKYFRIVDNEDTTNYSETGLWATSNSQAWGSSSRYMWAGYGGSASFRVYLKYHGTYEISSIVPTTQNAIQSVLYTVKEGTKSIGSVIINQNTGSGTWVPIGKYYFKGIEPAEVTLSETGPLVTNRVMRADALKFQLTELTEVERNPENSVKSYSLMQNYPNPFNPVTAINYNLAAGAKVELKIYNSLGQIVKSFDTEDKSAGTYQVVWNAELNSTGIYYCCILAIPQNGDQTFRQTIKMLLLK